MMRFFYKGILLALFMVSFGLIKAQSNGPGTSDPPCGIQGLTPPCPAATSPIDMYVYVLAMVAILAIAYYAKRYNTQKI